MQLHWIVLCYDSHESVICEEGEECEDAWLWDGQAEPGVQLPMWEVRLSQMDSLTNGHLIDIKILYDGQAKLGIQLPKNDMWDSGTESGG